MNSDQNSNRHKGISMTNQVGEGSNTNDGSLTISDAQLKQLFSLLNNQNEGFHSKENAVTKPGLSKIASRNWIIDGGVTNHITSSSNLLHKDNNFSLPPVLLPSGERANIVAKGSLPLNSVYYLHDLLFVPTFKVDLMLVSRLTRGLGCSVTFFPCCCILQDLAEEDDWFGQTTRWAVFLGGISDEAICVKTFLNKKLTSL